MRKLIIAHLLAAVCLSWGFGLSFHDDGSVDIRIVAVVGNTPILSTELDQVVFMYGIQLPADSEEVYKIYGKILNDLIAEQVIYQAALAESITVDEETVNQEFSARWDSLVSQFGSEQALEETLAAEGLSLSSFKRKLKDQVREGLIKQMFVQRHLGQVEVSDEEVQKFYEENRDSLGEYPEQVKLRAIVISPPPESVLWAESERISRQIYDSLRAGMKFADAVEKFSDDTTTKHSGGYIGEFAPEDLPENFRNALQNLSPGEYTQPLRGSEGYHILKLNSRRGGKLSVSHIFTELPDAGEMAHKTAQAVYDSAVSGVSFDSLFVHHTKDSSMLASGGEVGPLPVNSLPPALAMLIDSLGKGAYIPPIEQNGSWLVLNILDIIPAQKITPETHLDYLRELARRQKFSDKLDQLVRKLAKKIYVEVRDPKLARYVDITQ